MLLKKGLRESYQLLFSSGEFSLVSLDLYKFLVDHADLLLCVSNFLVISKCFVLFTD